MIAGAAERAADRDRILQDLQDIVSTSDCSDFLSEVADYILRRDRSSADDAFVSFGVFNAAVS